MFSPLDQFDVFNILYLPFYSFDFSFTNVLLPLLLIILFNAILFINYRNYLNLIPKSWQQIYENMFIFVFNIVKNQIGVKGYAFFPLIFTLFLFILYSNFLGLMPFGIALTSHLILLVCLSLGLSLGIFIMGVVFTYPLTYLYVFIPQCPFFLLPLLILIEIFSYVIRSISLAIRLAANILAGHTLVFIISSFLNFMIHVNYLAVVLTLVVLLAILVLETFVSFLQAYVYVILISIYLKDAVYGPSH